MWYHFGEMTVQQVQQSVWLVARKKGKNTDELAGVMAECNTLNWLSHPNIVQLLSCKFHGSSLLWPLAPTASLKATRSSQRIQELLCVHGLRWQRVASQAPAEQARWIPSSGKNVSAASGRVAALALFTQLAAMQFESWEKLFEMSLSCGTMPLGTIKPDLTCPSPGNSSISSLISFGVFLRRFIVSTPVRRSMRPERFHCPCHGGVRRVLAET